MSKNPHNFTRRYALLTAIALGALPTIGTASTGPKYPSKPITLVVPFAAGAGTDIVARAIAEKLGTLMGSSILVENKPGAAGVIGTNYVSKSVPDGHTLLFTPNSFAFAPLVTGSGRNTYDPITSFKPVIEVCKTPVFLVAGPKSGTTSFKELLEKPKHPPAMYGSAGNGSVTHLIGEAVKQTTGIGLEHIPYKGTSQAMTDLLGGHVAYTYAAMSTIEPHLQSQRLHILATTSQERTELAPSVPTLSELGYSKVNFSSWYGIFAPKETSNAIVEQLNLQIDKVLKMPDVIATLKKQGSTPVGGAAQILEQTNKSDLLAYRELIKELKISAN